MRNTRKETVCILIAAMAALAGAPAFAQAAIDGVVSDLGTGAPLEGVSVALYDQGSLTLLDEDTTDATGEYSVTAPDANDPLKLEFTKADYVDKVYELVYAPRTMSISLRPLAPAPPASEGFLAMGGRDKVFLTWRPNTEPDLAGYNVYRDDALVNTGPIVNNWFADQIGAINETYKIYQYSISAVNLDDIESDKTGPVEAKVGQIVVWINSVEMPQEAALESDWVRVPVNVFNAGFTPFSMDIAMSYPTELFDAAEVARTPMSQFVFWQVNVPGPSKLDYGQLAISGLIPETAPIEGQGRLVDLYLHVRDDATDGCGDIQFIQSTNIDHVQFYDWTPARIPTDYENYGTFCLFTAPEEKCLLGDVNGDTAVDDADILAAQRIAVEIDSMDPPEWDPEACMWKATDLNGDQVIDSADCILIQRIANGLSIEPPGTKSAAAPLSALLKQGETRTVTVASVEATANGDPISVPVTINNESFVTGFDMTIGFEADENLLVLDSVEKGGLLTEDFTLTANTETPGAVVIAANSAVPLTGSAGGTLAVLHFHVPVNTPVETVLPLNLTGINLTGEFGDAFDQQADIAKVSGQVVVIAANDPGPAEGEGKAKVKVKVRARVKAKAKAKVKAKARVKVKAKAKVKVKDVDVSAAR